MNIIVLSHIRKVNFNVNTQVFFFLQTSNRKSLIFHYYCAEK